MSKDRRNWLVTGCSTGLGRALAEMLIERGERVFATARQLHDLDDLVAAHENATALQLDVTKADEVAAAVAAVEMQGGIDILVNNAGYGLLVAIEEADEDAYRAQFEANVFGLIAMTRAALPHLRARGFGHIVNVSSVAGLVGTSGAGYYAATKFAVVGFSEALSNEIAPFGLKVTVVLPGPFRTDWAGRSLQGSGQPIAAYADTVHARLRQVAEGSGKQAGDPVRAAEAMIAAVDSATPPLRLVLGAQGLKMAKAQIAAIAEELDRWEETSLGADYPDGA